MLDWIPRLETDRLLLRGPESGDFDLYRRFYADAEASHFYGGPLRADQAWKVLAQQIGHWQLRGYGLWILIERKGGEALGGCGLYWAEGWPRPELTWWLLREARGQGYATEASRAVMAYAKGRPGWPGVETHMDDNNEAARRLALRLGGRLIAREPFPDGRDRNVYRLDDS